MEVRRRRMTQRSVRDDVARGMHMAPWWQCGEVERGERAASAARVARKECGQQSARKTARRRDLRTAYMTLGRQTG
eukprot:6187835-Pleurochrysis_carterae.AAC.1